MKYLLLIIVFCFLIITPSQVYAIGSIDRYPSVSIEGCLEVGFWVEKSFYDFAANTLNDPKGFDKWVDKQIEEWNRILQNSGVKGCFKIKEIFMTEDNSRSWVNDPRYKDFDISWTFIASSINDINAGNPEHLRKVLKSIDYGLLHDLSHVRYLIDEYGVDIDAKRDRIDVIDPFGDNVVGKYFPKLEWNIIYKNKTNDLMADLNRHFYSPHSIGALSLVQNRRFIPNTPTFAIYGIYLNDLPANNILRILDSQSKPLVGTRIRIFQSTVRRDKPSLFGKSIDNVPDTEGFTDNDGKVSIGSNPFGDCPYTWVTPRKICTHGQNSVFILEVLYKTKVYYKILEVSDFNIAYWNGAVNEATYDILTDFLTPPPQCYFNQYRGNTTCSGTPTSILYTCDTDLGAPKGTECRNDGKNSWQTVCLPNACINRTLSPSLTPTSPSVSISPAPTLPYTTPLFISLTSPPTHPTPTLTSPPPTCNPSGREPNNPSKCADSTCIPNDSPIVGFIAPPLCIPNPNINKVAQTPTPTPTLTLAPSSATETPTSTPTLITEPTPAYYTPSTYTTPEQTPFKKTKVVRSITINGQSVNLGNFQEDIPIRLNGTEGQGDIFSIAVVITYSYGNPRTINLLFNYKPVPLIPTATSTPIVFPTATPISSPPSCDKLSDPAACNIIDGCIWEAIPPELGVGGEYCKSQSTLFTSPIPTPTPTLTASPIQSSCTWSTFGTCGNFDCNTNQRQQVRYCDGKTEYRCAVDSSCPIPTPTAIPGSCRSYKDNLVKCVDDKRCKWTGSLCVDK